MDHDLEVTGELTNAELLQAVKEISQEVVSDDENEDSEPSALTLCQKINFFRQFIQETGMQTAVSVFKQVESMVYSEASATRR